MQISRGCSCTLDVWGLLGLPSTKAMLSPEEQELPNEASMNFLVQHP